MLIDCDAATITSSVAGGRVLRNARAAASRAAADVEVTMRMRELLPDALPDHHMNAAPRRVDRQKVERSAKKFKRDFPVHGSAGRPCGRQGDEPHRNVADGR